MAAAAKLARSWPERSAGAWTAATSTLSSAISTRTTSAAKAMPRTTLLMVKPSMEGESSSSGSFSRKKLVT